MIEAAGVSARAGTFRLIDISFAVPAGGYGVVIGPAGAGKTTLLEAISGVTPLTRGTLKLDGRDVAGTPTEDRRIGLVYQHSYLFPHLSVADNITYGAPDRAEARRIAERLGADGLWHRAVRGLSGGEQQLVALARALARQPSILLLDEPFVALDPRRRAQARRAVRALHRERKITVLHVTHDFTDARRLGDVAILLDAGRVVHAGPPQTLFGPGAPAHVAAFLGGDDDGDEPIS
jgi:ABC-type sugar transport system ATPase subunit